MDKERIVSGNATEDEQTIELSLRPKLLKEYIGQQQVKDNLEIAIAATRSRGEALDHVLLYGPRDWERRLWQRSLPTSWALGSR